jgi:hypothetical protein
MKNYWLKQANRSNLRSGAAVLSGMGDQVRHTIGQFTIFYSGAGPNYASAPITISGYITHSGPAFANWSGQIKSGGILSGQI